MHALLIVTVVWVLWLPVALLERAAKRDPGGVSIFPALPVFPLAFWGIAELLDRLHPSLGLAVIGGLHGILLVVLIASALRSWWTLRRARPRSPRRRGPLREAPPPDDSVG